MDERKYRCFREVLRRHGAGMERGKIPATGSGVFKKNHNGRKLRQEEKIMSVGWKLAMIQESMKEEDNWLTVSMLCEIAKVSRSSYYRWVQN